MVRTGMEYRGLNEEVIILYLSDLDIVVAVVVEEDGRQEVGFLASSRDKHLDMDYVDQQYADRQAGRYFNDYI